MPAAETPPTAKAPRGRPHWLPFVMVYTLILVVMYKVLIKPAAQAAKVMPAAVVAPQREPDPEVSTRTVGTTVQHVRGVGTVVAHMCEVRSPVTGKVLQQYFREGGDLGKGVPLLDILGEQRRFPLVAPLGGRIGLSRVRVGDVVREGDLLVTIVHLQPVSVIFKIPQEAFESVRSKFLEGKELEVEALGSGGTQRLALGKWVAIDNLVDAGMVRVRAEFNNSEGRLLPNQTVEVQFTDVYTPSEMMIPETAVQQGPSGPLVYLVCCKEDQRILAARPVRLGPRRNGWVSILEGLSLGDTIAVSGMEIWKNGRVVTVRE